MARAAARLRPERAAGAARGGGGLRGIRPDRRNGPRPPAAARACLSAQASGEAAAARGGARRAGPLLRRAGRLRGGTESRGGGLSPAPPRDRQSYFLVVSICTSSPSCEGGFGRSRRG